MVPVTPSHGVPAQVSVLILLDVCNAANNEGVIRELLQGECLRAEAEVEGVEGEKTNGDSTVPRGRSSAACHHL